MLLKNSVGRKGVNEKADVKLIQEALNRFVRIPHKLLKVDGIAGPITIFAIEQFQREALGFVQPDGLVDVDGKTWKALKGYLVDSPTKRSLMYALFPVPAADTPDPEPTMTARKIAWGAKVSGVFKEKVLEVCEFLDLAPDFLMSCMAFETAETFRPDIKNAAGSGAVGLIQFMPNTAEALGTSTEELAQMTAIEQLDYVKKYFAPYRDRLKTLEDVYMAILYPAAVGQPESHVLFTEGKKTYSQNKALDANLDGKITLREISTKVRQKYEKGLGKGYLG